MSESMNRKPNDDRQNAGRRLHLREVSSEFDDYDGIGADLKAGRVRLGQDIPDLANILRIRSEHLLAVEQGRFSDLPAPVYAVGFVRTYAEHVGLNGENAIRRFKEEAEGLPHHTNLSFPTPEEESRVPKGWLLALAGIVAVLVYAGWYYAENKDRLNLAEVPAVPERLAAKVTTVPAGQAPVRLQAPAAQATRTEPVVASPVAVIAAGETENVVQTPTSDAALAAEADQPETQPEISVPAESIQITETSPSPQPVSADVETTEPVASEPVVSEPVVSEPVESEPAASVPVVSEPVETVAEQPQPVAVVTEMPVPAPLVEKKIVVASTVSAPVATIDSVVTNNLESTSTDQSLPAPVVAVTPVVAEEPVQIQAPAATATAAPASETISDEVARPALPQVAVIEPEGTISQTRPEPAASVPAPVTAPAQIEEQANIPVTGPQDGRKKEAFGSPPGESRVEVYARVDVWVQVTSRDGQPLLSRILRQGDSYYSPVDQAVFLTTGNAGALQILVDGVLIPAVGPAGAVRRDISLDPVHLLSNSPGNQSNAGN
ncbi:MAG: DUF4115 domain-containing protein [Alphaproteobacteria bacterium]|nr:DUF4115 domain-containing protein [Alphaproteobacteria bacterium]